MRNHGDNLKTLPDSYTIITEQNVLFQGGGDALKTFPRDKIKMADMRPL